jgi:DNA-binding NarL/FixJ family response regulator
VGELRLADAHYEIVRLPAATAPGVRGQTGLPDYDALARFTIGDERFCIVPAAGAADRDGTALGELLTAREIQIATLVALGRLNKQIAAQLHISEWTVATHVRRILCKLGVHTRAGMVYRCAALIDRRPDLDA